jgi:hypothetical protein
MSFAELKDSYLKLPAEEQEAFARFVADQDFAKWDEQIAADAKAGRLDALLKKADEDIGGGRVRELP